MGKRELGRSRSEILRVNGAVETRFALHCSSGLLTLNFTLPDQLIYSSKKFESLPFPQATALKPSSVLLKKCYKTTARRPFTRMHENE